MCALYDVFDSSFVFQPCLWCQRTHIVNAVKYSDPCDLDSGQSSSAHRNRPFLKGTDGSYSECLCNKEILDQDGSKKEGDCFANCDLLFTGES